MQMLASSFPVMCVRCLGAALEIKTVSSNLHESTLCFILQFWSDTPKNSLGQQSNRHKPRVLGVETQRAQVRPMPSVSAKVLLGTASYVGHIPVGWQPQWKKREGPSEGQVVWQRKESLAPCSMSGIPLLGTPGPPQMDNMVCLASSQTVRTRSSSYKDRLGKLALCCLWALEPDTCSLVAFLSQVLAEGLPELLLLMQNAPPMPLCWESSWGSFVMTSQWQLSNHIAISHNDILTLSSIF